VPTETKYCYQDLDSKRGRLKLNGANRYTVTFAKDQTPPVNGFWSLTLYSQHHSGGRSNRAASLGMTGSPQGGVNVTDAGAAGMRSSRPDHSSVRPSSMALGNGAEPGHSRRSPLSPSSPGLTSKVQPDSERFRV